MIEHLPRFVCPNDFETETGDFGCAERCFGLGVNEPVPAEKLGRQRQDPLEPALPIGRVDEDEVEADGRSFACQLDSFGCFALIRA